MKIMWRNLHFVIVSVSPHECSWLCQFLHISFHDCQFTITKTYVEKLTQSRKRMWRNWHNHETLCGETDTIMSVSPHKCSWLCQFLHISFHDCQFLHINFRDCVSFSTKVFMIMSVSPHKFSWLCQFLHIETDNHENLCGETDTIMNIYEEKLTQSRKLMWRNLHNHENLCGETDNHESFSTKVFMIMSVSPHKFSWLCQFLHMSFHDCVSFSK
jgi:hypothetical protein